MSAGRDAGDANRATAGPVAGDGGALRARASSAPPSPPPPAEEPSERGPSGATAQGADQSNEGSGVAAQDVEADLDKLLADTQRERDEYLDLAKRTKADFENFRKRMTAETAAALGRGKADVIREVAPVLDDLERAIQAAGLDPEGDSEDGLAHGVLLVFRSLREALLRSGVEAVDPKGERFDPNLHEALSTLPADGAESGTVIETMQKGYRLGEQLIRPARVVVAE